jgi:hypothetical protein
MGVWYRVGQFVRAVSGPRQPPNLEDLAGLLDDRQLGLFRSMAAVDQYHCLRVARALMAGGCRQPAVLQAALIHDAGKAAAPIRVWERVAHVLLQHLAPGLVGQAGSPVAGRFGHGLYVLAHHGELGAQLAARAGFAEATVALLRGAGDPDLENALRRADDAH